MQVTRAHQHVQELVSDVQEGETYTATVMELKDFGAVVRTLASRTVHMHMYDRNVALISISECVERVV